MLYRCEIEENKMNLFRMEGQGDRAKTAYTPFPRSGGIVKSWYINKQQIE